MRNFREHADDIEAQQVEDYEKDPACLDTSFDVWKEDHTPDCTQAFASGWEVLEL